MLNLTNLQPSTIIEAGLLINQPGAWSGVIYHK